MRFSHRLGLSGKQRLVRFQLPFEQHAIGAYLIARFNLYYVVAHDRRSVDCLLPPVADDLDLRRIEQGQLVDCPFRPNFLNYAYCRVGDYYHAEKKIGIASERRHKNHYGKPEQIEKCEYVADKNGSVGFAPRAFGRVS